MSKPKTVGEFVEHILKTDIQEARYWIERFKRTVPNWREYAGLAITTESVESIGWGISAQITEELKTLFFTLKESWREMAKKGRSFLQEVHSKARELGMETDFQSVCCIIYPESIRKTEL